MRSAQYSTAVCAILTDFNGANLASLLKNDPIAPVVTPVTAPLGPFQAVVANPVWSEGTRPDAALIWTRPETAIPPFRRVLEFERVEIADVLADVDRFCELIVEVRNKAAIALVASWTLPPSYRGLGILDFDTSCGAAYVLSRMNLRLAERLSGESGVFVLNAERWIHRAAGKLSAEKLWYLAKVPFANDVFAAAVQDVKAALRAVRGASRKLLVLDLDGTLWGGIVGDTPWEQLRLGGHDAVGEAFQDFQRALKALARRGVVLAIASKNEEPLALEAIRWHPEMILRETDFAAWRINWNDKAANIADIASGLRLSLDATVFIDDSPLERERVRSALTDVYVPEWPADPLLFPSALASLTCFDTAAVTAEDALRVHSYAAERDRAQLRALSASDDEWLRSLDAAVEVRPWSQADMPRIVQLLNKTNQMNLTTRRLTDAELVAWLTDRARQLWTLCLKDRFGEYGLVGLLSLESAGADIRVVDFVLSCRAFGRGVEQVMLALAIEYAGEMAARRLILTYKETPRNVPCLAFLRASGLDEASAFEFIWPLERAYRAPAHVAVDRARASEVIQ